MTTNRNQLLKAWIAAILWLIVIAIESSALLSAGNTSRILYPILHFLFGVGWDRFAIWHVYIRKTGHVIGYGILSVLAFRAWRETFPARGNPLWSMRWASIAVLMTLFVASLDEWHQSFLPSAHWPVGGCSAGHVGGNRSADDLVRLVEAKRIARRSQSLAILREAETPHYAAPVERTKKFFTPSSVADSDPTVECPC